EQPEFLADDGEDEVGRALRQEFQLCLTAVHVSLAENAARADGNLRLDDMIARAEPIGLGIEECQDTLALVVVNEVPGGPCCASKKRYRDQYDLNLQAGEQHDDEPRRGNQ